MIEILNNILNYIYMYYGEGIFLILAIMSYVYLIVKSHDLRGKILYPIGLILFCIVNPILYKLVFSHIIYWRLFWIMPDAIIISLAAVKLLQECGGRLRKISLISVYIVIIVLLGQNAFTNAEYVRIENQYKISAETVEICDIILEVSDEPKCIMPESIFTEVRQYSGVIEMMYGRNADEYISDILISDKVIFEFMESDYPNYETILAKAVFDGYNFLVCEVSKPIEQSLLDIYGFEEIARTKENIVYYYSTAITTTNDWFITQYGYKSSLDNTFYTLEDHDNHLIIVDGGRGNSKLLREIIHAHDNHVDAWIITSPHIAHLGIFDKRIDENKDIIIDTIYTIDINYDRYKETEHWHGYVENYAEFLSIAEDMDNIEYVQGGTILDICGLEMSILNAWDEIVDPYDANLAYNGSMVFSVKGQYDSMLFCMDATDEIESRLIEQIGDSMSEYDYIQTSNYGDNRLSDSFYSMLTPNAAFVDVCVDKIEDEGKRQSVNSLLILFNENKIKTNTFDTFPNMTILH